MEDFSKFNGKPAVKRSEKLEFKPVVIKKDNMDQDTKDQREYLGLELFGIFQQINLEEEIKEVADEDHQEETKEPD